MGTSQININDPVTVTGGASFVSAGTSSTYTFNVTSSNVSFNGMTFSGTTVGVTGNSSSTVNNVTFTNNIFENYTGNGVTSILYIAPIHANSQVTGNTFQNLWYGGFDNTNSGNVCTIGGAGMCNNGNQSLLVTGIFWRGHWGNNLRVENNTFTKISGDGMHIICQGCNDSSPTTNVSVSYNTFTYIHRIGLEVQSNRIIGNLTTGLKIAGNMFYHPAYSWSETYAYSLPLEGNYSVIMNNAAIADVTGNTAPPRGGLGYAFEAPPGGAWATYQTPSTGTYQGNVVSGDAGWADSFVTYYNPQHPTYYQNNLLCGAKNNTSTYNISGSGSGYQGKSNEVGQFNYNNAGCPNGGGTSLWASNIQAAWSSADHQSFPSGGNGTWNLSITAKTLPIRYVQFFVDGSTKAVATQELQDVNSNFASDRKWLYHATINTSTFDMGTHTLTAKATDVSGKSQTISQTFFAGAGGTASAQVTPSSLSLGTETVGLRTAAQTVTLKNSGTAALAINGISLNGADSGDFGSTSTCGTSLTAGSSCGIAVTFVPSKEGSETAALSISDNAAGSPHSASLSGTGVSASSSTPPPPSTSPTYPSSTVLPTNLPKGMLLWLANDAGIVTTGNGVSAWQDQSGNGNDAVQSVAVNQPVVVPGNNQQKALRFDGSSKFLSVPSLPIDGLTGMTVFLVSANSKDPADGSYGHAAFLDWPETSSWGETYFGSYQNSSHFRFGTMQTGNDNSYPTPFTHTNSFGLGEWMHAGTTDSMWFNAQSVASYTGKSQTLAGIGTSAFLGQGADGTFYSGDVSELLIYNRSLNASERQQLEQYLMVKYHL